MAPRQHFAAQPFGTAEQDTGQRLLNAMKTLRLDISNELDYRVDELTAAGLHHHPLPANEREPIFLSRVLMRSTVQEKQRRQVSRSSTGASLSVVVVSSGSAIVAQRATQALKIASADLNAQFIVVSQDEDPSLATIVERSGGEFVAAPAGSSRAEMCDLGMMRANGTIVAVRDDAAIGDAGWLDVYRQVLPRREVVVPAPVEAVVMDTLVASRAGLADAVALSTLETRGDSSSIGMAAAV